MITPEIQKQTKNEVVKYQDVGETLMIPGRLETQNRKLVKIGSPITGRVSDLYVSLGDVVKKRPGACKSKQYRTDSNTTDPY